MQYCQVLAAFEQSAFRTCIEHASKNAFAESFHLLVVSDKMLIVVVQFFDELYAQSGYLLRSEELCQVFAVFADCPFIGHIIFDDGYQQVKVHADRLEHVLAEVLRVDLDKLVDNADMQPKFYGECLKVFVHMALTEHRLKSIVELERFMRAEFLVPLH